MTGLRNNRGIFFLNVKPVFQLLKLRTIILNKINRNFEKKGKKGELSEIKDILGETMENREQAMPLNLLYFFYSVPYLQ